MLVYIALPQPSTICIIRRNLANQVRIAVNHCWSNKCLRVWAFVVTSSIHRIPERTGTRSFVGRTSMANALKVISLNLKTGYCGTPFPGGRQQTVWTTELYCCLRRPLADIQVREPSSACGFTSFEWPPNVDPNRVQTMVEKESKDSSASVSDEKQRMVVASP